MVEKAFKTVRLLKFEIQFLNAQLKHTKSDSYKIDVFKKKKNIQNISLNRRIGQNFVQHKFCIF